MRRTKEDAEQTKEAILMSAMDLFYEKGYSKTTFDEIAKRINLTKGAVYWYFRNKPDIVAALINRFVRIYLEKQIKTLPDDKDLEFSDLIEYNLSNNYNIVHDERIYKFIFFISCQMEWSEAILTKIRPMVEETKNMSRNVFFHILEVLQKKGRIKKDVNIVMISNILMTMYTGIVEAFLAKRLETDINEMVKTGFGLIYDSIKSEE